MNSQILCDKNPVFINELPQQDNLAGAAPGECFRENLIESNSAWLKWQVAEPGTLAFTILPLNEADDIDFVLYRLKNMEACSNKAEIRCMAAGPNLGEEEGIAQTCTGATGLRAHGKGDSRPDGCPKDADNFLRQAEVQAGEYYALFINNFRSSGGVVIEWGGTATFLQVPGHCMQQSAPTSSTLNDGSSLRFSQPFPNPVADVVYIQAVSEREHAGQLQVIGSDGQLEMTQPFAVSAGGGTLEIPVANLEPGVHFLKLRTGAETYILRFVKH